MTPDPLLLDGGSSDACGIQRRTLSPATFTLADYLTSTTQTIQLRVEDPSGNSDSCTTTITLDLGGSQFVKMPTAIPLYVPFDLRWPAQLPFFPGGTKIQIKLVHPTNKLVFVTPFSGDLVTGAKTRYAVSYLNPGIKYNVEVTIGNYRSFVSGTLFVSIR